MLALVVLISLLSLPSILKDRAFKTFNDEQLRQRALDRSMVPIPNTYDELLKIVDSTANPMSLEKIFLGKELFFDKNLSKDKDISCATCHLIKKENKKNSKTLLTTISTKNEPYKCI
jgi:cytochrome c peroxidase